jgi:hypothetical protein
MKNKRIREITINIFNSSGVWSMSRIPKIKAVNHKFSGGLKRIISNGSAKKKK